MITAVILWAAAATFASPAEADTVVVEGGYESVWEGATYSRERFRWMNGDLDVCADLALLSAQVAVRMRDGTGREGLIYEAVFQMPDDVRRLSVRVTGDTLRWGTEDPRFWIERKIPFDPSRPLLLYQSGIFSGYAQFTPDEIPSDGESAVQVLLVDGGVLDDWSVRRNAAGLAVTSPEDVTTILHADGTAPPSLIEIPEQDAEARAVSPERISTADEFARCLQLVDLPPPD